MIPEQLDLLIEELVLEGFSARDREQIAAAVERELARLLMEQGVPTSLAQEVDVARLESTLGELGAEWEAAAMGERIARAIYEGLRR